MVAALMAVSNVGFSQKKEKKKKGAPTEQTTPPPKKGGIEAYTKVITKDAETDEGVFKVHKVEKNYFYEIPDSLLEREMLMVTRIAKTAAGMGFGGGKQNEQVLRWQRHEDNILLRVISYEVVAADSLPVHEAVVNSNFEPILYMFPIKAFGPYSTTYVIDVTDFLSTDIAAIGLPSWMRQQYKVSRMDDKRSYI